MVGFARTLRAAGVAAGPARVRAWVDALGHLNADNVGEVYWSGRLTLCSCPDDLTVYDTAFAAYFGTAPEVMTRRRPPSAMTVVTANGDQPGRADASEDAADDAALHASGTASRREVLRHRDLSALRASERDEIARMLALLRPVGPTRRTRRHRPARAGTLDPRRTVRRMLHRGGEPDRLRFRRRTRAPRRLVLLIDVSGSMTAYADGYLRFAHAACRRRPSTEVFTIGTRLTRVSVQLRQPDPDVALAAASAAVPDWSGGTRLGEQLKAFLDRWGQRGVARGAVVVVASDGWERGDVTLLATQTERLQRLANRVVWVSPHAGKPGFAPEAAGLRAVLPAVDALVAGHSVDALERLAALLSQEDIHA
jgi:uncharacterized protein with von Willebrand factor type A (vWA) domain